jgi:hypothetical protein
MLTAITNFFDARRDKKELAQLRVVLGAVTQLFQADDITLMIRTGSRIRGCLEKRFGSEYRTQINDDDELMREARVIENLPTERLFELSRRVSGWADRSGAEEDDIAPALAWRLLTGWLKAKAIARRGADEKIVEQAREHEDLYFFHIKSLLRIVRGEST